MKHPACPNCLSEHIEDFFSIKDAPCKSVVTIKSYQDAISIPKQNIVLSFCSDCGFIFNRIFDTSIDHFTQGYEDQQGFSATFTKFITAVTKRFIEKYDLKNKNVIEIGCGKGDFLNLICELGENRGIGIDPAYVPGRTKTNPNIRFIPEFYSEKHGDLPSDVITCRHTLEHIPNTNEFLATIRKSIGDRKDVILFFEIPSIVRILEIQAFWDIFYEHCSYFSPGSLARLFRQNNFEILDLYLEYDNQYLFIEARPVTEKSNKKHPLEESIDDLKTLRDRFVTKVNDQLSNWRKILEGYKKENKTVVLWGGGSKSVGFLTHFHSLNLIHHVVDINPHMQGNFIPGIGIQYITPDQLKVIRPDIVVIMNVIYKDEIQKMLSDREMHPEIICL